jgi:hypothetical protein
VSRLTAPLIGALCMLGACASSASAATLAVSGPDQQRPQPLFADVSGTADADSTVNVYFEVGGTSCGTTSQNHFEGRNIEGVATVNVPAGAFALRATQPNGGSRAGAYRMCAYLVRGGTTQDDAAATATLRYLAPPCPSSAFTITGAQDTGDGSATVGVTIPAPGNLSATGSSGGSGSAGSPTAGPASLRVIPSSANQGSLMSGIPVTETFTITYSQVHMAECADAGGATVTSTSESRTIVVSFKPTGKDIDGDKRPTWLRAVGGAALLNLYGKPGVLNQFFPICERGCEDISASMTIKVSKATQRRYRLPSRTIAKSGPIKQRGEALVSDLIATKAMVARLKKAKVKKLTTTATFVAVSPVKETVVKQQVFRVGRYNESIDVDRFCMGTAKDKICGKKK